MNAADAKPPEGYFLIPRLLAFTLTGLAGYIALMLTVLAIGVWVGLGTDHSQDRRLDATLGALVAGQIQNCRDDHRFRVQYRERGVTEKRLLDFFLHLARANVAAGLDPTGASKRFIDRFQPLSDRIRIIPVPNCDRSGERLREIIERAGITVPPLPSSLTIGPAKRSR